MATQHDNRAGKRRHRAWPIRVGLVLAGAGVIFLGTVAWSLSDTYRGDVANEEVVYSGEADGPTQIRGESGGIFEGTQEEVDAFVEAEQGSRDVMPAILMFIGGGLLVLFGILPARRTRDRSPEAPSASTMSA